MRALTVSGKSARVQILILIWMISANITLVISGSVCLLFII
jgi:hypothetical protein